MRLWTERRGLLLAGGLAVAVLCRLVWVVALPNHPGPKDLAFYYSLAQSLLDGHGFTINYVWYFLGDPPALRHYAVDFWQPFAAVPMAASMAAFGRTVQAAILPSVLFGVLFAWLTWQISLQYTPSRYVAAAASATVLCIQKLFEYSLYTDPTIYAAFFGAAGLLLITRGAADARWYALAAVAAGLAYLTRTDGGLLMPVMLVAICFTPRPWVERARHCLLACGLFLLVVSPLLVGNLRAHGTLGSPGSLTTMWLVNDEQFRSYGLDLSPQTYLDWGLGNIIASKVKAAVRNVALSWELFGAFLVPFALVGICQFLSDPRRRAQPQLWLPITLVAVVQFVGYSTAFSVHTSMMKSVMTLFPWVAVAAFAAVRRAVASPAVAAGLTVALLAGMLMQSVFDQRIIAAKIDSDRQHSVALDQAVRELAAADSREPVLMTHGPWSVNAVSLLPTVMIPSNPDLETIATVAARYQVTYLASDGTNPALAPLIDSTAADPRFVPVARAAGQTIFRVEPTP